MSSLGGSHVEEEEAITVDSIAELREAQTTVSNVHRATSNACGQA